jgi:hypothetical protein
MKIKQTKIIPFTTCPYLTIMYSATFGLDGCSRVTEKVPDLFFQASSDCTRTEWPLISL